MPSYKDLMPSLQPLQNTIKNMTDFRMPNKNLNSYYNRARKEASNQTSTQRNVLKGLGTSLTNQRKNSLNNLNRSMGLLPNQFMKQLQDLKTDVSKQSSSVYTSGQGLQNMLMSGISPLQAQSDLLQKTIGQRGQIENEYLNNLMTQVYNPQRKLAAQQGEDATKRYQTYVNEAQKSIFEGRISEAENLLSKAQLEYNSLVKAEEEKLLRQQMGYQTNLSNMQDNSLSVPEGGGNGNFSKFKISSHYGGRTDPFTKKQTGHKGVDFAVPANTPIAATVGGKVIHSGWTDGGFGNYVAVRDNNGLVHIYGHLNGVSVKAGSTVGSGQIVGRSGSTGRSTGPHLHYEVRKGSIGGGSINPMRFV